MPVKRIFCHRNFRTCCQQLLVGDRKKSQMVPVGRFVTTTTTIHVRVRVQPSDGANLNLYTARMAAAAAAAFEARQMLVAQLSYSKHALCTIHGCGGAATSGGRRSIGQQTA